MCSSGDYAEFQWLTKQMDNMEKENYLHNTGNVYGGKNYAAYLAHLSGKARDKMAPINCETVVACRKNGENYLATVDMYGNLFEVDYCATSKTLLYYVLMVIIGLGRYCCAEVIEKNWTPDCSLEKALEVMKQVFVVLFARWKLHAPGMSVRIVKDDGVVADRTKISLNNSYTHFKNKPLIIN